MILSSVLDLLFPPKCTFCMRLLRKGEQSFCNECEKNLPVCAGNKARQDGDFFTCCVSPLYYKASVRESVIRYKFGSKDIYACCYGKLLAECIEEHFRNEFDIISWVPVGKKRLKERGYDQAKLLAEETARKFNMPLTRSLIKIKDNHAQSSLGQKDERRANVTGVYRAVDEGLVQGKRMLLIDDVITTGATLAECSRTLLMAGADEVLCATLARSAGSKDCETTAQN